MLFRGYQVEMDIQVAYGTSGADDVAQVMQLTQVKFAHTVSSAVGQAIRHNPPPATAKNDIPQTFLQCNWLNHPSSFMCLHLRVIIQQAC